MARLEGLPFVLRTVLRAILALCGVSEVPHVASLET